MDFRKSGINVPVDQQQSVIGTPFDPVQLETGVIELFATWCPPCRAIIPHLAALQSENPHVKILQISNEPQSKLAHFYKPAVDKITFAVSSVPAEIWESISDALGIRGIPHAIILHKGVVVYSGHPGVPEFATKVQELNKLMEAEAAKAE